MIKDIGKAYSILHTQGLAALAEKASVRVMSETFPQLSEKIPKKKGLVVFSGRSGKSYSNNSWHLYKYLTGRDGINPVWLSKNKKTIKQLENEGLDIYFKNSLVANYLLSRAEYVIYTHHLGSLPYEPSEKTPKINLWHGSPVRSFGALKHNNKSYHVTEPDESHYLFVTSEYYKKVQRGAMGYISDNIKITGYPRNDILVDPPDELDNKWADFVPDKVENTILYAPTQRDSYNFVSNPKSAPMLVNDFKPEKLVEFLKK